MTQNFKSDAFELQMEGAGRQAFDAVATAKEGFFEQAFECTAFLLMLYDSGRMPFVKSVPRAAFVNFIKQAIQEFQVTGTFESYLFMIRALFGESATVQFTVPAEGKLTVVVNAPGSSLDFFFLVRDLVGTTLIDSTLVTSDGDDLILRGISGIESEAQLKVLFSELIPTGVFTGISLTFFVLSQFVANYAGDGILFTMLDSFGNEIVFYEP